MTPREILKRRRTLLIALELLTSDAAGMTRSRVVEICSTGAIVNEPASTAVRMAHGVQHRCDSTGLLLLATYLDVPYKGNFFYVFGERSHTLAVLIREGLTDLPFSGEEMVNIEAAFLGAGPGYVLGSNCSAVNPESNPYRRWCIRSVKSQKDRMIRILVNLLLNNTAFNPEDDGIRPPEVLAQLLAEPVPPAFDKEDLLRDALQHGIAGAVLPKHGAILALTPKPLIEKHLYNPPGAKELVLQTPITELIPAQHCEVCALGGLLHSLVTRTNPTVGKVFPRAIGWSSTSVEYQYPSFHDNNPYFEHLSSHFSVTELQLMETAFEGDKSGSVSTVRRGALSPEVAASIRTWRQKVLGYLMRESSGAASRACVDDSSIINRRPDGADVTAGLYLQIMSNALRNGGTFDPSDTRILTAEEIVGQAYTGYLPENMRAGLVDQLGAFTSRL